MRGEEEQFRAEMTQSEIEWLRAQVRSLRAALHLRNQDSQRMSWELEQMNQEILENLKAMPPNLDQAKGVARMLLVEELSTIEALTKLLSFVYEKPTTPDELRMPAEQKALEELALDIDCAAQPDLEAQATAVNFPPLQKTSDELVRHTD